MGDYLERGLQDVRRACDLDAAGKHAEALPLYRDAISSFRNAYNAPTTSPELKTVLIQKIREYEARAIEVQKLVIYLNPVTEEERLMASTISAANLQQITNQLFPGLSAQPSLSPEDILLNERIEKLKGTTPVPVNTQDNINGRIAQLSNGVSFHTNTTFSVSNEDLSEQEQVERILAEAHDSVHLEILSVGCNIREQEEAGESDRKVTHNRKNNKANVSSSKNNKKKHSSSSDSSDDSLSSSEDDSSSEEDTQPVDSFKQREKVALRKMREDEKARKRQAYQQFLKNQYK